MRPLRSSRRAVAHARFALFVVLGFLSASAAGMAQGLAIGTYHLQGSTRVSITQYDYTYTADVTNSGAALQGVVGTVTSSSPNTLVMKSTVNFGSVGANSTMTSTDTFTIRQDRRYAFDPSSLSWTFAETSKPTANAGPGQTVSVGQTVTLNGTGSTDPNGHPLTYAWSFVSVPSGSTATLTNPTSAMPIFTVDRFGDYTVQLVVNNGTQSSDPATVKISTSHTAPTANAGPNQTAPEGTLIQLDGSGSIDPDGNPLTYAWSFVSVPSGSAAALSSSSAVKPTFTLDKFGSYVVQLVVSDAYLSSAPSTVTITTTHTPPVANAGPAQSVTVGKTVTLDGSLSSDVDGFPLTFSWSLLSVPAGSTATLTGATTVHPTFTVDVTGSYVVQLIVNDGYNSSQPATVTISTQLLAPTANAGPAQSVAFNSTVQLDGTGSSDPNGLPLTYAWTFLSKPTGSAASLSSATSPKPSFTADKQGTYVAQLIVNDGSFSSTPSTVSITASAPVPVANAGPNQTVAVGDTVNLTGVGSTDPAGNPLTYTWSFTATPGAAPTLSNASTATPSFVAGVAGTFTLQLVVNNGSKDSQPSTVQITAMVPTLTLSPSTLSFPDQAIGTSSSPKTVTASNNTAAPITIASIGATNDFSAGLVSTCGATLLPGSNCSVSVIFSPSATGARTGALSFNDNAAGTPQSVSLSGNGIPGTATKLVIGTQPTDTAAGAGISPAITVLIEDASGNTVTSANGAVTLALANNPSGATLSGTTTVNAVSGVATFSGVSVNRLGIGYTLSATAAGLTAATTAGFNISSGVPSKLAFSVQPGNTAAGASITPAVTVTIQDAGGNTVAGATNQVTLALGANPGSGTLGGTLTVAAVNGVATFSSLNIGSASPGYTLVASSNGLTSATSNPFNVIAGTPTQLVFTVQPSTTAVSAYITPAVQVSVEDAQGNVVTTATKSINMSFGINPGGGSLGGTVSLATVNGVATFSNLSVGKLGTGYTLQASATGFTAVQSTAFDVTPGAASKLGFVSQPSNTAAGATITPAVTVAIQDTDGNTVTTASGAVTLAIFDNPSAGTLSGTLTANAVNGIATFPNLSINNAGVGYNLVATSGSLTTIISNAFNITPGTATKLAFTKQPSNASSGAAITPAIAVSIEDAGGNVVTSSTVAVTLAFSTNPGSGSLGGTLTVNAVNGVATFSNVSIDKAGTGYVLQAASAGLSPTTSSAFNITPGAAAKLAFSSSPQNTPAGSPITPAVTVVVQDAAGNTVTSATTTVTLALATVSGAGTLSGTLSASAVNGVATFSNLSVSSAGNYYLTASATGLTPANSGGFIITAGPATKLGFVTQPNNTAAGAALNSVQVAIQDATGTTNTTATNAVTLAIGTNPSSGTLSGTLTVNAVNGVATFTGLSINNPGTGYTLAASSASLTSATSNPFNITGLGLTITPLSSLVGVGTSLSGTVTLGQVAPSGGVVVSLSSSNPANVTISPASLTIAQGQTTGSFTYSGVQAGPSTLSASATGFSTSTANVTATASLISLGAVGNVTVGQTISLPLSLGTVAPSGGLTVNLTSSNPSIASVTSSVFIPAGSTIASANPQITALAVGTVQISATATNFAPNAESISVIAPVATLSPTPLAAHVSLTSSLTLNLSAPAPAGGTVFILTTDNAAIATVASPVTVAAGSTSATVSVTGVAIGSTTLRANSAGIAEATAIINVTAAPTIAINAPILGNNMIAPLGLSLSVAPASPQTLTLTSADPTHFLLSTSATAVGSSSVTVTLIGGATSVPTIYLEGQNFSGSTAITATFTASSSGYANGTGTATLYPSGFGFNNNTLSTSSFSTDSTLTAYLVVLNPGTLTYYTYGYGLGPQAGTVQLSASSSNTVVGTITGSPTTFVPGTYNNQSLLFHPVGAGTTNLTLAEPSGYSTPASSFYTQTVATVTASTITVSAPILGNNMIAALSVSLGAAAPSNQTLTLTSSDPTHFLLSTSPTAIGSSSVTVNLTGGSASVPAIYLEGQNYSGTTAITATLTASSTGFTTGTGAATLYPSGFGFNNNTLSTTSFSTNSTLTAYFVVLNPGTLTYYTYGYNLGPQAAAVQLSASSSNTAVGTIIGSPTTFVPGTYYNQALAFHPVGAGTTNLTLTEPSGYSAPAGSFFTQTVATVTAPAITVSAPILGNNMITALSVSLGAAPPSNQTLTLTSSDPTHFLLSTSPTAIGSSSVTVNLTGGSASVPAIYLEGQNYTGTAAITATLTASSTSFTSGTGTATLYPSGFGFNTNTLSTTTFSSNSTLTTYLVVLNPGTLTYYTYGYGLGPQASAVSLAVASSSTTVGTIVGSPATFVPGTYNNQAISFHPVSAGTTNLTLTQPAGYFTPSSSFFAQTTATVSAPAINVSSPIVGNNTYINLGLSLGAAPPSNETLTLTSTDPTHFLLATSQAGPGSASVTVQLTGGSAGIPGVYVQGQNFSGDTAITGSIKASAPGYSDGIGTATLYPTGLSFLSSSFSSNAGSTFQPPVYLLLLNPGTLTYYTYGYGLGPQTGAIPVAISSSNTNVGTITGSPSSLTLGNYVNQSITFHSLAAGTSTLTLAEPAGYFTPANQPVQATVTVSP